MLAISSSSRFERFAKSGTSRINSTFWFRLNTG
jgi:hypothetical protein